MHLVGNALRPVARRDAGDQLESLNCQLRKVTGKRSDRPARLVEGQRFMGWRAALNELDNA